LAEILRQVSVDEGAERRAIGFLERLWHYDQLVFDASRAENCKRDEMTVPSSMHETLPVPTLGDFR
jgi:hypothetical protein